MTSAIKRVCEMAGMAAVTVPAEATNLSVMLAKIRPAAHLVGRFRMRRRLLLHQLAKALAVRVTGGGQEVPFARHQ